jgi:hypothetical protein
MVETVCQLSIDAVVFDLRGEARPSMLDLMQCQFYADLTDKPLFYVASPAINAATLEALHKHGVDAVIMEISTKASLKQAANMRQTIDKLPPVKGRGKKREGLIASLGSLPSGSSEDDDYEEEEV